MGCITNTNRALSVELESFVTADAEVQSYLNKKCKVDLIKQKAEEELRVTLADADARKEQVHRASAMTAYMHNQAAFEMTEQIERQAAFEKHMAMERYGRFDKENIAMPPPVPTYVARHSPVRETIVRRSVSPLSRGAPLGGPPPVAPGMHYSNFEKRYGQLAPQADLTNRWQYQTSKPLGDGLDDWRGRVETGRRVTFGEKGGLVKPRANEPDNEANKKMA